MKRKIKRKTRTRFKRLGFFQVLYTLLYSRSTFGWVEFILSWTIWVLSFFVISSCIKSVSNKSDIFVVFIHDEWSILDSKQSIQLFRKYKLHHTNSIPLKKSNKLLKHSHSLSFMILLHSPFFQIKSYFPTPFHFIMPCSHSPYKITTNFLQITAFFQKNIFLQFFLSYFSLVSQSNTIYDVLKSTLDRWTSRWMDCWYVKIHFPKRSYFFPKSTSQSQSRWLTRSQDHDGSKQD